MNTLAMLFKGVIQKVDPIPNSKMTKDNTLIKMVCDWGRKACDELDRLEEQLVKYRWIPVEEGLPEAGHGISSASKLCDLYMPEFNKHCSQKGYYVVRDKVWNTFAKGYSRTNKVTHWRYSILPEAK